RLGDLHAEAGGRVDDQRFGEQRVGGDRNEDERFDLGPDDGTAGGERVRGRAGGGGEDDAVAAEGGYGAGVDAEDDVDHPGFRGLLDGRLVERPGVEDVLAFVPHGHVEG